MNGKQWIGIMLFGGWTISAFYLIIKTMIFAPTMVFVPIIPVLIGIMIAIGIALSMHSDI